MVKLLRYNLEPLTLNINDISRVSAVHQSNIIVVMKNKKEYTGYLLQFQ